MAKIRLFGGKPLLINQKVALSDDCCCGGVPCGPCGGTTYPDCGDCNFVATISGVTIRYEECVTPAGPGGGSEIWHLVNPFNNDYPMFNDDLPEDNPPGGCAWFDLGASFIGTIQHVRHLDDTCTTAFSITNLGWELAIGCIGGTWYCIVFSASGTSNGFIMFYAESTNPASFGPNTVTYTGANGISIDNPFVNWVLTNNVSGGPCTFMGMGHSGTITTDFGHHA